MVGTVVFDAHSFVQSTTSRTVQMLAVPLGLREAVPATGSPPPPSAGRSPGRPVLAGPGRLPCVPAHRRSVPAGLAAPAPRPAEVADTAWATRPAGDGGAVPGTLSGGAPAGATVEYPSAPPA